MRLPRIVVDLAGERPRAQASSLKMLMPGDLTRLMRLDDATLEERASGDRVTTLSPGRWAVGRCLPDRVVWRLVDDRIAGMLGHAAFLWVDDAAFDPERDQDEPVEIFGPPALRDLLPRALGVAGSRLGTAKLLAAAIAAVRSAEQPIAIVVSPEVLESEARPARWFALALLASIPQYRRSTLRVSTHEVAPDDGDPFDLVFTSIDPGPDFAVLEARTPPDPGNDLVAYFVWDRLRVDDPEAIEEAAAAATGEGGDAWGESVRGRLREGETPEVASAGAPDTEGAIRALTAKIAAGASMTDDLAADLARMTELTGDPRPWKALAEHSEDDRFRAHTAWLEVAERVHPRAELIAALAESLPEGLPLDRWYATLHAWFRAGVSARRIRELMEATKEGTGTVEEVASAWAELVLALARRGHGGEVLAALFGPSGQSLAGAGAARALAEVWIALKPEEQSRESLYRLIDGFAVAPDGDGAAALVLGHLAETGSRKRDLLLGRWAQHHEERPFPEGDAVQREVAARGIGDAWFRVASGHVDPERLAEMVSDMGADPDSPLWGVAEEAQADSKFLEPLDRLLHMGPMLVRARPVLERRAVALLPDALQDAVFPHGPLCDLATSLAQDAESSLVWSWLAIACAEPTRFDEETVDATVVHYLDHNQSSDEYQAALVIATCLGRAADWPPLDRARWVVRLLLANSPQGLNHELALALVRGMAAGGAGATRLAQVTSELVQLPPEHVGLRTFVERLLPNAFDGHVPDAYRNAVRWEGVPAVVKERWAAALGR